METLNETKRIESYLFGRLAPASRLLFEARLLIDPILKTHVECQRRLYAIVKNYGRRAIKIEAEQVHRDLFSDPTMNNFRQEIEKIFTKK